MRFRAYGWHTQHVDDANDLDALRAAIAAARAEEAQTVADPRALDDRVRRAEQGQHRRRARRAARRGRGPRDEGGSTAGTPTSSSTCPTASTSTSARSSAARRSRPSGRSASRLARRRRRACRRVGPRVGRQAAARPRRRAAGLTSGKDKLATRAAGGETLQAIAPFLPTMVGGSADLNESVKTGIKSDGPYSKEQASRNVYWGIREHAMGAAVNGLALHGGIVRPYGATFLQFADYMRGAIRLSALMRHRTSRGSTRTTRSRSARTARRTSRSSTSRRCARSRT